MKAFYEGLFFGAVLAVLIGPVFFILVQTSIERGVKHGLAVAVGESVSDVLFLTVYYLGFTQIHIGGGLSRVLGMGGVLVLIFTGGAMIRKSGQKWNYSGSGPPEVSKASFFLKGFLINSLNPFVYVFWAGVMGLLKEKFDGQSEQIIMFCVGIFTFKTFADVLKAALAGKIKWLQRANSTAFRLVSGGIGVVLIIYAIVLFYRLYLAG